VSAARPRIVPAARGAAWLPEAWTLFRAAPLSWVALVLAYWMGMSVLSMIPVVGVAIVSVLVPGLSAGFMAVARAAERKERLHPGLLVEAFRRDPRGQLVLGAVYFACLAVVLGLATLADGGALAGWMLRGKAPEESEAPALALGTGVAMLLYLPVMMMFWYGPVLAAWHGTGASKSLFFSFFAVWMNRRAFLVYGAAVAFAAFALPFFVLLLFGALVGAQAGMPLAIPIMLTLMPLLFASFYASYRDVFPAEAPPSAVGG
jgi:hypothetical protein